MSRKQELKHHKQQIQYQPLVCQFSKWIGISLMQLSHMHFPSQKFFHRRSRKASPGEGEAVCPHWQIGRTSKLSEHQFISSWSPDLFLWKLCSRNSSHPKGGPPSQYSSPARSQAKRWTFQISWGVHVLKWYPAWLTVACDPAVWENTRYFETRGFCPKERFFFWVFLVAFSMPRCLGAMNISGPSKERLRICGSAGFSCFFAWIQVPTQSGSNPDSNPIQSTSWQDQHEAPF